MHRHYYKIIMLILIAGLMHVDVFAQKRIRSSYEQRLMQVSLRAGLLNCSLTGELKLFPKLNLSVDAGYCLNFLSTEESVNQFNRNYMEYYMKRYSFFNVGDFWWSGYASLNLRGVFGNKSKIAYNTPQANTFGYYGLQLKGTTWQTNPPRSGHKVDQYRETYRLAFIIGRQIELGKSGRILVDFHVGFGAISNYKVEVFYPMAIYSFRLGGNLWRKNS